MTAEGIRPLPDRMAAIKKFPQQATVQQLQTYLGMLNFYRHFIKGAACLLKPLTDALRESQWTKLDWTAEMLVAFNTSRALLSNITQLAHTHPTAELVLAVDASSTHVGAVLQPLAAHHRVPLALQLQNVLPLPVGGAAPPLAQVTPAGSLSPLDKKN